MHDSCGSFGSKQRQYAATGSEVPAQVSLAASPHQLRLAQGDAVRQVDAAEMHLHSATGNTGKLLVGL